MKIFLVEDDKILNEVITSTFESIGYEVLTFVDGYTAFERINSSYDLYLIDINLPHINGIELLKHIVEVNPKANIFIISAETNIEIIMNAYDIGCTDFIKKPFDIREIIAKIKNTLEIAPKEISIGACKYNQEARLIKHADKDMRITVKEALLLDILIENYGSYVSGNKIEERVWGETFSNGHVRQLISKLRKVLPKGSIENHTLNGYRLKYKL